MNVYCVTVIGPCKISWSLYLLACGVVLLFLCFGLSFKACRVRKGTFRIWVWSSGMLPHGHFLWVGKFNSVHNVGMHYCRETDPLSVFSGFSIITVASCMYWIGKLMVFQYFILSFTSRLCNIIFFTHKALDCLLKRTLIYLVMSFAKLYQNGFLFIV